MGEEALRIDANTFQFFTRNPRGSQSRAFDPKDLAGLAKILADHAFAPVLGHAPYTMNPCAADPGLMDLARQMMTGDLARLDALPGQLYNFHPGSHVDQGVATGIRKITDLLDQVLRPDGQTTVLLETMAGKGSEVGSTFAEIREIMDRTRLGDRLGVCLDTCHVYAAGYDVVNDLDGVLTEFDRVVGLKRLKAIHLNDSQTPLNSHRDRHACIGAGTLGLPAIVRLINHPVLRDLPFYLETPNDVPGYAAEIRLLREHYL
jgi:deoxyribonuclease-4